MERKIEISLTEWDQIQSMKACFDGRYKFQSEFSIYLSEKIQIQFGVKCAFQSINNWFLKDQRKGHLWQGKYKCIDKNCSSEFTAQIKSIRAEDLSVIFYLLFNQVIPSHITFLAIKKRCTGKERIEQGYLIKCKGLLINQSENIIHNTMNLSIRKRNFSSSKD